MRQNYGPHRQALRKFYNQMVDLLEMEYYFDQMQIKFDMKSGTRISLSFVFYDEDGMKYRWNLIYNTAADDPEIQLLSATRSFGVVPDFFELLTEYFNEFIFAIASLFENSTYEIESITYYPFSGRREDINWAYSKTYENTFHMVVGTMPPSAILQPPAPLRTETEELRDRNNSYSAMPATDTTEGIDLFPNDSGISRDAEGNFNFDLDRLSAGAAESLGDIDGPSQADLDSIERTGA